MIKVLVVGLTNTIGGVETFIRNVVISSNPEEMCFDFIIKHKDKAVFEDDIARFYNYKNKFHHVAKLRKNPVKWFFDMRDVYKKNKYDVIYINTCTASDILYACIFDIKGARIIMHSHYAGLKFNWMNHPFKGLASNKSTLRFACSERAGKWMFTDRSGFQVIKNGIDIEKYRFSEAKRRKIRKEYRIKENDLLIGHVGRLAYPKNQIFLIEIFNLIMTNYNGSLKNRHKNISLVLGGDGPDEDMLRRRIEVLGLVENIIMTGGISNADELYSALDLFVMPSNHEGLPVVGVEAQCSGLPCFFSDGIDRQVLITDRAQMIHLEKENQTEWAKTIWEVCVESDDVKLDNRKGYADVVAAKGYDMSEVCQKVVGILKE